MQNPKQQNPIIAFYVYMALLEKQIFTEENMIWHCAAVAVW